MHPMTSKYEHNLTHLQSQHISTFLSHVLSPDQPGPADLYLTPQCLVCDADLKRAGAPALNAAYEAAEEAVRAATTVGAYSSAADSVPALVRAPLQAVDRVYGTGESCSNESSGPFSSADPPLQVSTVKFV